MLKNCSVLVEQVQFGQKHSGIDNVRPCANYWILATMENIYTNELLLLWSVVNFLILYTLACGKNWRNISVTTTQSSVQWET
jgi:hypothetical protein